MDQTRSITGRPVAEITEFGRLGRLSTNGFLAEDEDVLCVIMGQETNHGGLWRHLPEENHPMAALVL